MNKIDRVPGTFNEPEQYSTKKNRIGDRHEDQQSVSYAVPYLTNHASRSCNMQDVELDEDDTESSEGSWFNEPIDDDQDREIKQTYRRRYVWPVLGLIISVVVFILVASTLQLFSAGGKNNNKGSIASSSTKDDGAFNIRISAGSTESYFDLDHKEWLPDVDDGVHGDLFHVSGGGGIFGSSCSTPIDNAGIEGEGLYCNERYFTAEGRYEIFVPDAALYNVVLYFADIFYSHENERVFDVLTEEQVAVENYDIIHEAGASFVATSFSQMIAVSDGSLSIVLRSKNEHAKINGIEVVRIADLVN